MVSIRIQRILGCIALLIFGLAGATYVLVCTREIQIGMGVLSLLLLVLIPSLAVLLLSLRAKGSRNLIERLGKVWCGVMVLACWVCFAHSWWCISRSGGGTPEERDGGYILSDHGKIIKTLTPQEYKELRRLHQRFALGAYMLVALGTAAMGFAKEPGEGE